MAENSNDRIQIRSGHISDEFYDSLRNVLPGNVNNNIREEIYYRFNGLHGDGQHSILAFLRSLNSLLSQYGDFAVYLLLRALTLLEDPGYLDAMATFGISRRSSLNMSTIINFSHPNFEAGTLHHTRRTLPDQHNSHLTDGASTQYDLMPVPSHHTPPDYGHVSINVNNTNLNYSTNTQSHSQRSFASSHGILQAPYGDRGASSSPAAASHTYHEPYLLLATPYGDPGASFSSTAAASHGQMSNSLQSHSQRPAASHSNPPGHDAGINVSAGHSGIFQATEISPYGDPGVSSSSTAAASHGEMSNSLQSHSQRPAASHNNPPGHDAVINVSAGHSGIFQATEISPYGDPGVSSSSTAAASHGEMSNSLQSHSQRPAASHNNPPGHDAVINVSAGHSGIFQATEISPSGDPGVSSSSTAAASHGEMSNSLQSHSQRPAASHNNPPGHDAVINVPAGHSGILQATEICHGDPGASSSSTAAASHGQTTRDGETAGHSKLFEILVPVNFNYAHKAGNILKSTYDSLSPSIKTSGYLTVAIASVAAFSSLAGLSLSTFKPNTLPFGWNPQLMLQIMHILTVFFFGYAFIGTMCHEFLHDDPIIFWMVEGLAYAILTAVLVFIIWRR